MPIPLTKAEVRNMYAMIDDWFDTRKADFNNALPTAAGANRTVAETVRLPAEISSGTLDIGGIRWRAATLF